MAPIAVDERPAPPKYHGELTELSVVSLRDDVTSTGADPRRPLQNRSREPSIMCAGFGLMRMRKLIWSIHRATVVKRHS